MAVLVYVADVERHFVRAKAAGATILSDIEEGPRVDDIGPRISKVTGGSSCKTTKAGDGRAGLRYLGWIWRFDPIGIFFD